MDRGFAEKQKVLFLHCAETLCPAVSDSWQMIIPVQCFTCGKVVANKYGHYLRLTQQEGVAPSKALKTVGLKRYCCKRMLTTHVDVGEQLMRATGVKSGVTLEPTGSRPPMSGPVAMTVQQ